MKKKIGTAAKQTGEKLGTWLLACVLCGGAVFCALFCGMAMLLCKADVPVNLLVPIVSVLTCISVLVAAYVFARLAGHRGLLYGLLLGMGLFLLLWLASALQGSAALTQLAAFKCLAMALSGAIGGYAGTLSAEKKHKIHP